MARKPIPRSCSPHLLLHIETLPAVSVNMLSRFIAFFSKGSPANRVSKSNLGSIRGAGFPACHLEIFVFGRLESLPHESIYSLRNHQSGQFSASSFHFSHNVALCNLLERFRIICCRLGACAVCSLSDCGRLGCSSACTSSPCGQDAVQFSFLSQNYSWH
jgi:hypothetical protein